MPPKRKIIEKPKCQECEEEGDYQCMHCSKKLCDDCCVIHCSDDHEDACMNGLCRNCDEKDGDFTKCTICEKKFCQDHVDECPICEEFVCYDNSCRRSCQMCGEDENGDDFIFCQKHSKYCHECGFLTCMNHGSEWTKFTSITRDSKENARSKKDFKKKENLEFLCDDCSINKYESNSL